MMFLCLAAVLAAAQPVAAQKRGLGLGLVLGEPTGLTAKLWTGGLTALTFGAAWSFRDGGSFHMNGDYLVHHDLTQEARKAVPGAYIAGTPMVYYGVGARLRDEAEDKIGVRLPLGFNFAFKAAPTDFFVELVPIMDLAPQSDFDMNGAIGFRYYF